MTDWLQVVRLEKTYGSDTPGGLPVGAAYEHHHELGQDREVAERDAFAALAATYPTENPTTWSVR